MDKELLALADDIATHPEIGFEEKRSVGKLTDYLRQHDFSVETGSGGLSTAFVAKYKQNNGAPTLGVILEYDALRGTKGAFHGDQHSAQGPVGMAAAIAMAEYLTPHRSARQRRRLRHAGRGDDAAEREDGDARGARRSTARTSSSAATRSSATSRPAHGFGTCCLNIVGAKYTFSGAPTHQMTPWNGRNALTAMIQLFDNIDARAPQHPAGGAHSGLHHRRRHGAERRARSHGRRLLHPLSRRGLSAAGGRVRRQRREGRGALDRHEGEDRSLRQGSRRHRRRDARPRSASRT